MGARYEFMVLGPLEIRRDGVPVPLGAARLRALLAALLVDAGRTVPVECLARRVWGDRQPARVPNTLQNYVLRLRRALGRDLLLTRPSGYLLDVTPQDVDLHRFTALVRRGRTALEAGRPADASGPLHEAVRLWRGDPLTDLPAESLREVLPALGEALLDALELRIDADLALGRHARVLSELRTLAGAHPLRERFHEQRMLALHRSGRQGEALDCYREAAATLARELGVDPGAGLRDAHRRVLSGDDTPAAFAGRDRTAGRLPAETTSFVGRERELDHVADLLTRTRLVTLTGVGGVGKTRLALRAATRSAHAFPDGVWLADLAPLTDPGLLDRTVAESLGLRNHSSRPVADAVTEHLRDRRLLLVLDNCEHLVAPVATLALRLLRWAPELTVLATSRERLAVPGEHVVMVPGLALPERADDTGCEALRLLADRAAASAPGFRVTDANYAAVAELCHRLDGIPLAVELAAVRLNTLAAGEILDRLDDRFRLLAAPRGGGPDDRRRTLRQVIDWSHDLCTEAERLLWSRVSVFTGSFDLDAAEAVCKGGALAPGDVRDLLAALVDKSIVYAGHAGPRVRYRLLETIRQYGRDRLEERGDVSAVRLRHVRHYRDLAARAAAEWCGPQEVDWLTRLRLDLPNIRSALDLCASVPDLTGTGLDIAVDLGRTRCWFFSSTLGEGRHWLERLLARPDGTLRPDQDIAARAMTVWIALCQGDRSSVRAFLDACRPAGAAPAAHPAVRFVEGAYALLVDGDTTAVDRLARAREAFRDAGLPGDAHMATLMWAMAAAFMGPRDTALATREVYVAEAEASGAEWARSWATWCAGITELRHGDPVRALPRLRDALARQRAVGDNWGPLWGVESLAWATAAVARPGPAATLLGAAEGLRRDIGVDLTGLLPFHTARLSVELRVREELGDEAYVVAHDAGFTAADRVALALELTSAKRADGLQERPGGL
ncbi:BTAD domain-containing putative transcriptional regulator [Streptomyces sp. NPDC056948]|uniref:BTAD domain-containing putative transcriptional regulator n=1 Tax=Streptomyces sp. NPDC056948 TaxID=3345975 RepID=UPI00363C4532